MMMIMMVMVMMMMMMMMICTQEIVMWKYLTFTHVMFSVLSFIITEGNDVFSLFLFQVSVSNGLREN
jgi:hypothetical protein